MNLLAWLTPRRRDDYSLLSGDNDGKGSSTQTSTAHSFGGSLLKTALVCLLILSSFFAGRLSMSVPKTEEAKTFGRESGRDTSYLSYLA